MSSSALFIMVYVYKASNHPVGLIKLCYIHVREYQITYLWSLLRKRQKK